MRESKKEVIAFAAQLTKTIVGHGPRVKGRPTVDGAWMVNVMGFVGR